MRYKDLVECTTSGGIASIPAGSTKDSIGVGFDPNADWGVYEKEHKKIKRKKKKAKD